MAPVVFTQRSQIGATQLIASGPVGDCFDKLLTGVNTIDTAQLAAAAVTAAKLEATLLTQYRAVPGGQSQWSFNGGNTIAKPWHWTGAGAANGSQTDAPDNFPALLIPIDPAVLAITGKTTKLRLRGSIQSNATAYGAATCTFGLYSISSVGGAANQLSVTLALSGWVTGGSVAVAVPGASTQATWVGTDFDVPAAGNYVLAWQLSAQTANAQLGGMMCLEYHYV